MHVTPAESEVLAALWRRGPLTLKGLIEEVGAVQPWGEATIKTLLNRLIRKAAVRSERTETRQRYHPLVDRTAYVDSEVQALLDRHFDGEAEGLLSHLAARGAER